MNFLRIRHLAFSLLVCTSLLSHASDAMTPDTAAQASSSKPRSGLSKETKLVLGGMVAGGAIGLAVVKCSGSSSDDAKKSSAGSSFFVTTAAFITAGAGLAGAGVYAIRSSLPSIRRFLGIQELQEGQQELKAGQKKLQGAADQLVAGQGVLQQGQQELQEAAGRLEGGQAALQKGQTVIQEQAAAQGQKNKKRHKKLKTGQEQLSRDLTAQGQRMDAGFSAVKGLHVATEEAVYNTNDEVVLEMAKQFSVAEQDADRRHTELQAQLHAAERRRIADKDEADRRYTEFQAQLSGMPDLTAQATVRAVGAAFLQQPGFGNRDGIAFTSETSVPRRDSASDKAARLIEVLEKTNSASSPRGRNPIRGFADAYNRSKSRSVSPSSSSTRINVTDVSSSFTDNRVSFDDVD